MHKYMIAVFGLAALAMASRPASASVYAIGSGSASMTLTEGMANSIDEFDAYFDAATTRADTLSLAAPGNASFTETPSDPATGTVSLTDSIRPHGVTPSGADGRARQATTLEIEDLGNVLGSWSTKTNRTKRGEGHAASLKTARTSANAKITVLDLVDDQDPKAGSAKQKFSPPVPVSNH